MTTATKIRKDKSRPADLDGVKAAEALARLQAAADAGDEMAFLQAYREIEWQQASAEEYARAVRLALAAGAHLAARTLAMAGAERFPEHPELRKMAHILAPPKARTLPGSPNTSWKANRAWLQQHWNDFRGHWVALRDGELLAVADDLDGLVAQVGEIKGKNILVTSIW